MKERPILFSGEMVRAILDGRKTQTRRVIKPQPMKLDTAQWFPGPPGDKRNAKHYANESHLRKGLPIDFCPYGIPGDRLWVRETWRTDKLGEGEYPVRKGQWIEYRATPDIPPPTYPGRWRASIHMPRWASRIDLEITDIRVERVQDISEKDAIAEGVYWEAIEYPPPMHTGISWVAPGVTMTNIYGDKDRDVPAHLTAQDAFKCLWDSINAKRGYGWDINPWVWVISFRRIEP